MCTSETKLHHESSEDDFFGANSDGEGAAGDEQELKREAAARHQIFYNSGYRDGLDEGKERSLQQGFNIGFREGALAGFEWGLLRGAAKTLAVFDGQAASTRGLHAQIQELEAVAEVPQRAAMLDIFRRILSQPIPIPEQLAAGAAGAAAAAGGLTSATTAAGPAASAPAGAAAARGSSARNGDEEDNEDEDEEDVEQAAREAAELAEAFRTLAASASSRGEGGSSGPSGSQGAAAAESAASTSGRGPASGSEDQPGGGDGGESGVVRIRAPPPQLVPPDAAAMALPDMGGVMGQVRRRLQELSPKLDLSPAAEGPVHAQPQEEAVAAPAAAQ